MPAPVDEDEDGMLKRAIAMSLEEQPRVLEEEEMEEEMLARVLALSTQEKFTTQRETGELPYFTRYVHFISNCQMRRRRKASWLRVSWSPRRRRRRWSPSLSSSRRNC